MSAAKKPFVATSAPTWHESSIEWLKFSHPHLTLGSRRADTIETKLLKALRKMSFAHPHHKGEEDDGSYAEDLEVRSIAWDRSDHEEMIMFLEAGGFVDKRKAAKHVDPRIALEDDDGPIAGLETLGVGEAGARASKLHAAVPDELAELEAAVEAEQLKSDDRFGAW